MTGMKKNRIFSAGVLAAGMLVLSACTVSIGTPPQIKNSEIRTSWEIPATNEYVVCENQNTMYEFRFDYELPERIRTADILIRGVNIGQYSTTVNRSAMTSDADHDFVFDITLSSSLNPYPMSAASDLQPQAIIVRPLPPEAVPAAGGQQTVTATLRDSRGVRVGSITGTFDVWGGCSL